MLGVLAVVALVAINGFFVAAEFAMVRIRPPRLERLARRGVRGAAVALKIVGQLERYLSVSQIGITLASLALGWIGEPVLAHLVERAYFAVSGARLGGTAHAIAVGVSFGLITYLHVLFGEQAPKLIALHQTEAAALALAPAFRIAFVILTPVRVLLEGASAVILRLLGVRRDLANEQNITEEELSSIISATMARGPAAAEKRQLVERVIRFASRQSRHAMVPRVDVAYLPINTKGDDAIAYLRSQGYSRIVLCERDDLDRVVGYLYAKDLLLDPNASELVDLRPVRRDVLFVPEPQSLIDVLRSMQHMHALFAVVVDEYGGTSGILTMEDLLEEIVGEIRDEADEDEVPSIREVPTQPGAYDVEATASLDELGTLGIDASDAEGGESVGAYVVRAIGRVPRRGDRVRLGAYEVEVRAVRRRRIVRVRFHPRTPTVRPMPAMTIAPRGNGGGMDGIDARDARDSRDAKDSKDTRPGGR